MGKKYHVAWRSIGLMLKFVLLVFVPLEITCAIIFSSFLVPKLANRFPDISPLAFIALGTLGIIIITLIIAILVYKIGTFLRLSSDRLEYHRWPFATIMCRWDETEKISQGNVSGIAFATLMIRRNTPGWEVHLGGGTLGSTKYKFVPLNDFQGWPVGDLMNEVKQYAPHLFQSE